MAGKGLPKTTVQELELTVTWAALEALPLEMTLPLYSAW